MRTKFLKSMMPAVVIVFAVAAAFATQAKEVTNSGLVDAYIPMGINQPCTDAEIQCYTDILSFMCTTDEGAAYGLVDPKDKTSCRVDLYLPSN